MDKTITTELNSGIKVDIENGYLTMKEGEKYIKCFWLADYDPADKYCAFLKKYLTNQKS